jgi:hypothetical protein
VAATMVAWWFWATAANSDGYKVDGVRIQKNDKKKKTFSASLCTCSPSSIVPVNKKKNT